MIAETLIFAVAAICVVSLVLGRWPWHGASHKQEVVALVLIAFAAIAGLLWLYPELRKHEEVRMEYLRDSSSKWQPDSRELVADGGRE